MDKYITKDVLKVEDDIIDEHTVFPEHVKRCQISCHVENLYKIKFPEHIIEYSFDYKFDQDISHIQFPKTTITIAIFDNECDLHDMEFPESLQTLNLGIDTNLIDRIKYPKQLKSLSTSILSKENAERLENLEELSLYFGTEISSISFPMNIHTLDIYCDVSLKNVTLPNKIKVINYNSNCEIKDVIFPKSVEKIVFEHNYDYDISSLQIPIIDIQNCWKCYETFSSIPVTAKEVIICNFNDMDKLRIPYNCKLTINLCDIRKELIESIDTYKHLITMFTIPYKYFSHEKRNIFWCCYKILQTHELAIYDDNDKLTSIIPKHTKITKKNINTYFTEINASELFLFTT